ncbi:MAG: FkbM family methyltransferase [Gelidibacter sp.]
MALRHTIDFILNHPLNKNQKGQAIWRFLKWQVKSRVSSKSSVANYGEKSKIIVKKGLTGATGNLYSGLHEFEDMSFLLHLLRDTDMFIDVGANVGSYTILGSNERGAETISIEPIPQTFEILQQNVRLNEVTSLVTCKNIGMGNENGILKFTKSLDTVNHVAKDYDTDTVNVKVERFDEFITLHKPTLIKIDVEGFETEVLNGMKIALADEHLKAIIIELNGSGGRYGFDENLIHEKFLGLGFVPFAYEPYERKLTKLEKQGPDNTIYIKDLEFVSNRLKSAEPYTIRGQKI